MTAIEQLMYLQGVALDYRDYSGNLCRIADSTRKSVLAACGHDIKDAAAIANSNFLLDAKPWQDLLPATVFVRASAPKLLIRLAQSQQPAMVHWSIFAGDDLVVKGEVDASLQQETGRYQIGSELYIERSWSLNALAPAYYRYRIEVNGESAEALLIVSPDQAYNPYLDQRFWGLSTQLYSVRSDDNYGIGDFRDLTELVRRAGSAGANFVMLNPLHALFPHEPERASPYSPSDRFLLNPVYIFPDDVVDFTASAAVNAHLKTQAFKQQLKQLRSADWIDYSAVVKLKYALFGLMFEHFCAQELGSGSVRESEFNTFCDLHHARLSTHADWLSQCLPGAMAATDNMPEFTFYLQWIAHQQLAHVQASAIASGMQLGLIRDLAVGCTGDGSEVARHAALFVTSASIGAPPDPLGPQGQNWGLPPIDPLQLKADNYQHFMQLVASNMRDCGALRIDHVMGLLRLWWCLENQPTSGTAADGEVNGCYVYYPFAELMEILKLESVLNRCVVIGEDLGIVPEQVKEGMAAGQLYSNLLFYFEQDHQGEFRPLSHITPRALMMIANHDVPPFACWWQTDDLRLRQTLNLFTDEQDYQAALQQRKRDKDALLRWLGAADHSQAVVSEPQSAQQLFKQLAVKLAGSPVSLFAVQLEDLDAEPAPVNIPGTDKQYPNWRRRLSLTLPELLSDQVFWASLQQARQSPC
ncbi:4-alpha-glucanotransferase [Oceanicoccus sp. KOV_DT_Chl]|uniref:4-alpha-glucanotransferase n=1 Tax=Oceanicoccus sp. KOV_DT_Chl TaxID=1904639 RepID=UPI000C7BB9FC|nr:4-alpha-glucanotransferase [Oceanicoccus sp. KOV_DT_Chl]